MFCKKARGFQKNFYFFIFFRTSSVVFGVLWDASPPFAEHAAKTGTF